MNVKHLPVWGISMAKIDDLLDFEPFLLILVFVILAYLFYRIFLKRTNPGRHLYLRAGYSNLFTHTLFLVPVFGLFHSLRRFPEQTVILEHLTIYVGLLALISGAVVLIKTCRLAIFEYLIFRNMRQGVPMLLEHIGVLFLSVVVAVWFLTEIFSVRLGPLLATSAILSIVLGLALQDTLGNLFAGVAMRLDRGFEIGDWLEIRSGVNTWVGQVTEITWRSTILQGLQDEEMIIPNRVISSGQISNFSPRIRPYCRTQSYRIDYRADLEVVKNILLESAREEKEILQDPAPTVLVAEITESWVTCKQIYFLSDYAAQWRVGDRLLTRTLAQFVKSGIKLAISKIEVIK